MSGQHLPADHSLGDANTIGGYAKVHGRPAAFDGSDGLSYSVELCVDQVNDAGTQWAAYLLFLRWRRIGASGVEGHLETDYLARATTPDAARAALAAFPLQTARGFLEQRIAETAPVPARRWFDVMRDESDLPDVDPHGGDAQVGDPQVGDAQVGDPQVGDPQVGDPQVGDPHGGHAPERSTRHDVLHD